MASETGQTEAAARMPDKRGRRKRGSISVRGYMYRDWKRQAERRGMSLAEMVEKALEPLLFPRKKRRA